MEKGLLAIDSVPEKKNDSLVHFLDLQTVNESIDEMKFKNYLYCYKIVIYSSRENKIPTNLLTPRI